MKNIDYVSKIVAKNNKLSENLVKKVNSFFWKEVNRKVYEHEEMSLYIREIGTFIHSMKKVRTEILWLITSIRIIRKTKKFREDKRQSIEDNYIKYLRKLLKQHNSLAILHKNIEDKQEENKKLKNEQAVRIFETNTESNT